MSALSEAIEASGLLGCGCCAYPEGNVADQDSCPTDDGYKDHSYDSDCFMGLSRAEQVTQVVLAAIGNGALS